MPYHCVQASMQMIGVGVSDNLLHLAAEGCSRQTCLGASVVAAAAVDALQT
jgi:hypothetical protein